MTPAAQAILDRIKTKRRAIAAKNPHPQNVPAPLYFLDHSSTHEQLLKKFYQCNGRNPEILRERITRHPKLSLISTHRDLVFFNNFVIRILMDMKDNNKHQMRLYYVSHEVKLTTWIATTTLEGNFWGKEHVYRQVRLAILKRSFKMTDLTRHIRCWN